MTLHYYICNNVQPYPREQDGCLEKKVQSGSKRSDGNSTSPQFYKKSKTSTCLCDEEVTLRAVIEWKPTGNLAGGVERDVAGRS